MAYTISPKSENYIDTPLSKFPTGVDVFDRKTDVDISTWPLVVEYEQFLSDGDFTAATNLLRSNPDLVNCIINAEVINQHADAIMAIEHFVLTDIDELYTEVAQSAIGINDNPTAEEASYVSLSAEKVLPLFNVKYVTLPLSGWSSSAPYKLSIDADGFDNVSSPIVALVTDNFTTQKEQRLAEKSWGYVNSITIENGKINVVCKFKRPVADIPLIFKGV